MDMVPAWGTWLDPARASRTRGVLTRIAESLLGARDISDPPELVAGRPGLALAHAYLAQADFGERHAERCQELLEQSIAALADVRGLGGLWHGVSGPAFVLEHLGASEEEDACAELDAALAAELAASPELPAELIVGLCGRGVYALERASRGVSLVGTIADRLVAMAEARAGGVAWRTRPTGSKAQQAFAERHPDGWFNLGVAHGAPAVIAFLAACRTHARAREAARAGMAWLWSRRHPAAPAAFSDVDGEPPFTRSGWCYGDEGIAAVGWQAASALEDAEWRARWLSILRDCAKRSAAADEAGLCHGTAGLAHLYHRVFQATAEPVFADAALRWLDATLDACERQLPAELGLLTGAAGIALALSAFVGAGEPAWDRVLMLSLRLETP
jgi:hypothetical protein